MDDVIFIRGQEDSFLVVHLDVGKAVKRVRYIEDLIKIVFGVSEPATVGMVSVIVTVERGSVTSVK